VVVVVVQKTRLAQDQREVEEAEVERGTGKHFLLRAYLKLSKWLLALAELAALLFLLWETETQAQVEETRLLVRLYWRLVEQAAAQVLMYRMPKEVQVEAAALLLPEVLTDLEAIQGLYGPRGLEGRPQIQMRQFLHIAEGEAVLDRRI
jgi:hypothetical protein